MDGGGERDARKMTNGNVVNNAREFRKLVEIERKKRMRSTLFFK